MGLFTNRRNDGQDTSSIPDDPAVTYNITHSLTGKLTASPSTTAATTVDAHSNGNHDHKTYNIVCTQPKGFRTTIDVSVYTTSTAADDARPPSPSRVSTKGKQQQQQQQQAGISAGAECVGHCLIEVANAKFIDCSLGDGTPVVFAKSRTRGPIGARTYKIALAQPGRHGGEGSESETDEDGGNGSAAAARGQTFTWRHDKDALGGRTTPDRRLRLEDGQGKVVARFAGAATGLTEFGLLEVYREEVGDALDGSGGSGSSGRGPQWFGLVLLTAVCVYAREESQRQKSQRMTDVAGFVGNWGGLLTMGIPMGGA